MSRQPARVHKPFHRLNRCDRFFIGSKAFWKVGFCRYQQIDVVAHTPEEWGKQTPVQFIAPWTVVRSDEYVNKKILPAQLIESLVASARHRNEKNAAVLREYNDRPPYTAEELEGTPYTGVNKTHYVGDDCPGGHGELTDTCERPRVEQPNSDNGVKGPTS